MTRAAALLLLFALGCEEEASIRPEPLAAPAAAAPAPAPLDPYRVRFVRPCPVWSGRPLLATTGYVMSCARHDAESGALIDVPDETDLPYDEVAVGERSVEAAGTGGLILRDADRRSRRVASGTRFERAIAPSPDGARALVVGPDGLAELDLASAQLTPVAGSRACGGASQVGYDAEGRAQCVVYADGAAALRTVGLEEAAPLASYRHLRWDPRGGRLLVFFTDDVARWLRSDGAVIAERPAEEARLLAIGPEGEALVEVEGERTERWTLQGDAIEVETLFPRPASAAAYAGSQIVLSLPTSTFVWLHRGPARRPPVGDLEPPEGFTRLAAGEEDGSPVWRSETGGSWPREGSDVAAFVRRHVVVTVARTDRAELARFEADDAAWARVVAARFVEPGAERWATYWRDDEGRALRGHAYIGGCERTHVDVLARERGDAIELRVMHTGLQQQDREALLRAGLGAVPADALPAPGVDGGGYPGDPSIGRVGDRSRPAGSSR